MQSRTGRAGSRPLTCWSSSPWHSLRGCPWCWPQPGPWCWLSRSGCPGWLLSCPCGCRWRSGCPSGPRRCPPRCWGCDAPRPPTWYLHTNTEPSSGMEQHWAVSRMPPWKQFLKLCWEEGFIKHMVTKRELCHKNPKKHKQEVVKSPFLELL